MKKYFFDVTDIVRYMEHNSTISGIQRVTLMLIGHVAQHMDTGRVFISYYDDRKQKYLAVSARDFPEKPIEEMQFISDAFSLGVGQEEQAIHQLKKYRPGSKKYLFHKTQFDIQAFLRNEDFFKKRGLTSEEWKDWRSSQKHSLYEPQKKDTRLEEFEKLFQPGDVLCLLGLLCGLPQTDKLFEKYAEKGLDIFLLVHDTIPLIVPDTVYIDPIVFLNWLRDSTRYCTAYMANSKSTEEDLRTLLDLMECPLEIHRLPLAQDKVPGQNGQAAGPYGMTLKDAATLGDVVEGVKLISRQRPDVLMATKMPYVLCVGTMEARKNCWRIAQAWSQLAAKESLDLPRLVFAGKSGWLNDDFLQAFEKTGGWGGWVHIIEKPSDRDLYYLYENCEFTITASLYEGWGLPIGESLSHGKTGVVSNTSSMPEVGMDLVEYCNPSSITSIAAACEKLVRHPEHRVGLEQKITQAKLRQWSDVGADLMQILPSP